MQQYSHRNGETEPPTEAGIFWFRGKLHHEEYYHDVADLQTVVANNYSGINDFFAIAGEECLHGVSDAEGQWWGPIVSPWEDET